MTKKNYLEPKLKIIPVDTDQMLAQSDEIGEGGGNGDLEVKGHRRGFSWDEEDEE